MNHPFNRTTFKYTFVAFTIFSAGLQILKMQFDVDTKPSKKISHQRSEPMFAPKTTHVEYSKPQVRSELPAPVLLKDDVVPAFSLSWLSEEAERIELVDRHPKKTERILYAVAQTLTKKHIRDLKIKVMSQREPISQRQLSLYLLRQNKKVPSAFFVSIALLRQDSVSGPRGLSTNALLALSAVEELQMRAIKNKNQTEYLAKVALYSQNPTLKFMAYQTLESVTGNKQFAFGAQ